MPVPTHLSFRGLRRLHGRLLAATLALSLIPLAALGWLAVSRASAQLAENSGERMAVAALEAGDLIDRNLFERYGDVQAFAANPLVLGTTTEAQGIVDFLTETYGIYDLMVVTDVDGRIRTANGIDGAGRPIDTSALIGRDMSATEWFTTSITGTSPTGGTHYTDAERSPLVGEIYGDDRITLPFSAPVRDADGEIVGVWHNQASFERVVSDIMSQIREQLAASGVTTVETQVLRSDGVLLDDATPDDVLTFDLADAGIVAAQLATTSEGSGYTREVHKRRGVEQFNGWAATDGALGFDGYGWGVLVRQETDEALAGATSLRNVVLAVMVVLAVLVSALAAWFARGVAEPIAAVRDGARRIAAGDLNVEVIEVRRTDEIGELATSFNNMARMLGTVGRQVDAVASGRLSDPLLDEEVAGEFGVSVATMITSLRTVVERLRESATQLAGASEELATVSATMGSRAELTSAQATSASAAGDQVSASVATVAAAIEEMNVSISEVAANAADASRIARLAVEVADTSSSSIARLDESSVEIGNVVKVINSIAEQTNLLALNAAIEAARAGDAGKGFAVVANEVKALANQTASATEEISGRISAIQDATTGAVAANRRIGETIDQINEISTSIASAVEEQSLTTAEIGRSVEEAAVGTSDMARSVTEVAEAAGETLDATGETRGAAGEMAYMAADLSELVGQYH